MGRYAGVTLPKLGQNHINWWMTTLRLTLFGQPSLWQDGHVVEFKSRKGWALLAYLALQPTPVSREELATLFWPEHEAAASRRNLRRLLYTLNQTAVQTCLRSDAALIWLAWQGEIDVQTFLTAIATGEWQTAVSLYQGELLAGVYVADSNLFESWLGEQREGLRQQLLQAFAALVAEQIEQADYVAAEATLRQQLAFDSWNEAVWRQLMTVLAQNGRRAQALAEYQNCRQLLQAELEITPAAETTALFDAVRDGRLGQTPDQRFAIPPPTPMPHAAARQSLLDKVQSTWIDTVLKQSLHGLAAVNLDKTRQPDAITYPWTTLRQRPWPTQNPVPTQTPIADLFDNEGRALLILGAPGSGKTTMLLELARQQLARAQADAAHPVPVVLNVASWRGQSFADWVIAEMNEKYLIPKNMLADWLLADQLLLLCDGLDELPSVYQADCVTAVNQFRQTRGLTSLVICSRQADYDLLDTPLNLNSAVVLQSLTPAQIDDYLGQWGQRLLALRQLMQAEKGLQQLARIPLMLSMMALVFQGMTQRQLERMGVATGEPKRLFAVYVQQMFRRRGAHGRFSPTQMQAKLHWLATELTQRNQPIFLLERLQPDWLPNKWQISLYVFLSRFIGAFLLGAAWVFRDFGADSLGVGIYWGVVVALVELPLFWWLGKLDWSRLKRLPVLGRLDGHRLGRGLVMATAVALFASSSGWLALVNGLIFGLFFGWRAPAHTAQDDIRLVEKLAWNWRSFGWGIVGGFLISIVLFFYNRADLYAVGTSMLSIFVLFAAFFGLQGRTITNKTRANEGMALSWRNAVLGGTVVGGAMFLAAIIIEFSRGSSLWIPVWVGVQYFVMAGLWYGGLDLINHFTLRGLLAVNGRLPWQAVSFLEQATHLIFLYRVGSGYIFVHPLLQAHFAEMGGGDGAKPIFADEISPQLGSAQSRMELF